MEGFEGTEGAEGMEDGCCNTGEIVRDWDGGLFQIAEVKGEFVVLMPVEGGEPLVTKHLIVDFFYRKMT